MEPRAVRSCGNRAGDRELGTRGQISQCAALAEVLDYFRVPASRWVVATPSPRCPRNRTPHSYVTPPSMVIEPRLSAVGSRKSSTRLRRASDSSVPPLHSATGVKL